MDSDHQYDDLLTRIRAHWRPSIFPPATEEQVQETERQLGFPLPPLLRLLYTEIANGGFGPGEGIVGTPGGFRMTTPSLFDGPKLDIVQSYRREISEAQTLLHLEDYEEIPCTLNVWYNLGNVWEERAIQSYHYELPDHAWPTYMLPLCYHGCTCFTSIDAISGRLFNERNECVAASLEKWFENRLAGARM
ncbi:SMI1/KNR4 family protein [Ktedonospora formicarum]|uniref:Knr4/Smi1-like domain-containing protein n=1 Tax=Ktedonospora formicarum TaxID=2778364 RepID=A0A8J3I3T4_9CHLR|nr:SMI1/KNR4 family protein [Ktedonospora formicarum]GHO49652.1 hypothetical protein KSX_78150 [Ktedonospora formicarum]